jgi:FAD-linked oxidoreductase
MRQDVAMSGGAMVDQSAALRLERAGPWRNWSGAVRATPEQCARPRSEAELAELLAWASKAGRKVRPVGSSHSFSAIAAPEDIELRLDRLPETFGVDRERGEVRVSAGTTLHRLNHLLAEAGLALPNLGDIDRQTVAGALATGTHGTGAALGLLGTGVRAVRVVDPSGQAHDCSPRENRAWWSALRMGLGALGVVTELTLAVRPAFFLQTEERPASLADLLANMEAWFTAPHQFEAYWFPHSGRCLTITHRPVAEARPPHPLRRFTDDELLANGALGAVTALGRRAPALVPSLARFTSWAAGSRTFSDASHRVLAARRRVRFQESEWAVPFEEGRHFLSAVTEAVERSGLRVGFPAEVRVVAADDIPLSPAFGRQVLFFAAQLPARVPTRRYFNLVADLALAHGGRPHWGKTHFLHAAQLRGIHPAWREFHELRDHIDPQRTLTNTYLERVLDRD